MHRVTVDLRLPWLTSTPLASVTARFEKAASSVSVNVSVTSWGAALTVEPADGLACVREACAYAAALTVRKNKDRATTELLIDSVLRNQSHPARTLLHIMMMPHLFRTVPSQHGIVLHLLG
jgi:hypothetical protein